ncbi:hypothetical protein [Marinomonas sp. THO17]|uniref:hypothetical protein n=1 Tax=Marinomonas sp. THO17 TaxID=3149048 RepID=UPI00336BD794
MEISTILDVLEKIETRLNSYWNFYTIVIVAVCGWLVSHIAEPAEDLNPDIAHFLAFGCILFFFMNLTVIRAATIRLLSFENALIQLVEDSQHLTPQIRDYLSKPQLKMRLAFTYITHITMDTAVIIFIYWAL